MKCWTKLLHLKRFISLQLKLDTENIEVYYNNLKKKKILSTIGQMMMMIAHIFMLMLRSSHSLFFPCYDLKKEWLYFRVFWNKNEFSTVSTLLYVIKQQKKHVSEEKTETYKL